MIFLFFLVSGLLLLLVVEMYRILHDEGYETSWSLGTRGPLFAFWNLAENETDSKRKAWLKTIFWMTIILTPLEFMTLVLAVQ